MIITTQTEEQSTMTGATGDDAQRDRPPQARKRRGIKQQHEHDGDGRQNVADVERQISVAAGSALALFGVTRGNLAGLLLAGLGGALVHRGVTGRCELYNTLGVDTAHPRTGAGAQQAVDESIEHGIEVRQAMLINKPAEELYRFWRKLENLPKIMHHLESVRMIDEKRSHWVAQAPAIAGGSVEWDAEITRDEPNAAIAWRSLPGSDIDCGGEIRFTRALGDRGTEVHVMMKYMPPAGKVGHLIAKLFGESPSRQIRDELRNFKRIMELGEILTVEGQPQGTCVG